MVHQYGVKYAGPDDDRVIASDTNPWIVVDGKPVDWMEPGIQVAVRESTDCEDCGLIPGVIEAMDTPEGVQRCDTCQRYEGDLFAAQALADHVGGEVWFTEERWIVRLYNNGWAIVADRFKTETDAQAFMDGLVALRVDGNTGLDVRHVAEMEVI